MDEVCFQTNIYVDQRQQRKPSSFANWKLVEREELWRFFALHALMGVVKKNEIKHY